MTFIVPDRKRLVQPGETYNNITVLGVPFFCRNGSYSFQCVVSQCKCGSVSIRPATLLKRLLIGSCGCESKESHRAAVTKHGKTDTPLYKRWRSMKDRCKNNSSPHSKWYHDKGIRVCDEWVLDFEEFERWSIENGYQPNLQLDRVDGNGNYCPENCRWVTARENLRNRSNVVYVTAFGETKIATDWTSDPRCVSGYGTMLYRIRCGWEPELAMTTPQMIKKKRNKKCHPPS